MIEETEEATLDTKDSYTCLLNYTNNKNVDEEPQGVSLLH